MACRCRGRLRTSARPRRLSLLRALRSAKCSEYRENNSRCGRRKNQNHAADQTLSGGKDVVCAFLDATLARILATRVGREIFSQITGGYSVFMAARSDAAAATRCYSAIGNSGLARSRTLQPERSTSTLKSERIFAARLGQPRDRTGER